MRHHNPSLFETARENTLHGNPPLRVWLRGDSEPERVPHKCMPCESLERETHA